VHDIAVVMGKAHPQQRHGKFYQAFPFFPTLIMGQGEEDLGRPYSPTVGAMHAMSEKKGHNMLRVQL
jgi:hypothetical protein